MTTTAIPQQEGEFTPAEAQALTDAFLVDPNLASNERIAAQALKIATDCTQEHSERMTGLWRRWRATWHLLAGNTLEKNGPEDVHVPEVYKAMETMIPRLEEILLGQEPFFGVIPKKDADRREAVAIGLLMDWHLAQDNLRSRFQPAARDMLVTQHAAWYSYWENKEVERNIRTRHKEWVDGKLRRWVTTERKQVIAFSGVRNKLIDPLDFIIDTKATNAQDAIYVGHRAWLTVDQIKAMAKTQGWLNVAKLDERAGHTLGPEMNTYGWSRDPTARYLSQRQDQATKTDGRPGKKEVVFLYTQASFDGGKTYDDYRIAIADGRVVMEVRVNPNDGKFRPYSTWRVTKSGHEFFGTGPFDNAVRLSQHLDRYWQITTRGAAIAGMPIGFAEDDCEIDSIYRAVPGRIYSGVGNIRFTQIPDGFLRSMPMLVSMMQKNIEETIGSFRINMGQDSGGTATEASLALQEGNRRMRGIVRACADGLEELLNVNYKLILQHTTEDVEFPVLGKRALDLKRTHMTVGPADLLDDVRFELVGLRNSRNYGLKATGWQAFLNSMTPFVMANPTSVDQVRLMHKFASEMVGADEADETIKIPTPLDALRSQQDENEGLIAGEKIEVDQDDNDEEHLMDLAPLWVRATNTQIEMHEGVRAAITEHYLQHIQQRQRKKAQEQAAAARQPQQMLPPEAGGQQGSLGGESPKAGGFSDAMKQLAFEPGGQVPGENPGPADSAKYGRTGRAGRTINQTENS